MFKKNLKLLATMVGLVAVLVIGLAMRGISQSPQQPLTPPSRADLVKSLERVIASLAAGTEVLYDPEASAYFSHPQATVALVPRHPRDLDEVREIIFTEILPGQDGSSVIIGGLYVTDPVKVREPATCSRHDIPFTTLPRGFYTLKLVTTDGGSMVEFINTDGETIFSIPSHIRIMPKTANYGRGVYTQPGLTPVGNFQLELGFWMPPVVDQSGIIVVEDRVTTILLLAIILCLL